MKPCHFVSLRSVLLAAVIAACSTEMSVKAAAPADEIRNAVEASGGSVQSADARAFTKAYSAVIVKTKDGELAPYVSAAVKLRPDLAPEITAAALRAHRHPGNELGSSCDWVSAIVTAAIKGNPKAAAAITKAAVTAEPTARKCIVAAAVAAAPDQRVAIEQAGRTGGGQTAFFRPAGVDAGNINSSAIGTINPANMSAQGTAVSPENKDRQTICHNGNTLVLPRKAAEAHLRQHPGDRPGACQ